MVDHIELDLEPDTFCILVLFTFAYLFCLLASYSVTQYFSQDLKTIRFSFYKKTIFLSEPQLS